MGDTSTCTVVVVDAVVAYHGLTCKWMSVAFEGRLRTDQCTRSAFVSSAELPWPNSRQKFTGGQGFRQSVPPNLCPCRRSRRQKPDSARKGDSSVRRSASREEERTPRPRPRRFQVCRQEGLPSRCLHAQRRESKWHPVKRQMGQRNGLWCCHPPPT